MEDFYWSLEALKKARDILDVTIQNFEPMGITDISLVRQSIDMIDTLTCECDDYNGFDCGCSKRRTICGEALKELSENINQ